jgi:hypothetical protein
MSERAIGTDDRDTLSESQRDYLKDILNLRYGGKGWCRRRFFESVLGQRLMTPSQSIRLRDRI